MFPTLRLLGRAIHGPQEPVSIPPCFTWHNLETGSLATAARWFTLGLLLSLVGCRSGQKTSAPPAAKQAEALQSEWRGFVADWLKDHPVRLGTPRAVTTPGRSRPGGVLPLPGEINQQDPRFWVLSIGETKVDPEWFKERVRIHARLSVFRPTFDLARQQVAEALQYEAMAQAFWRRHPDLLSEAEIGAAVAEARKKYTPAMLRALLQGELPAIATGPDLSKNATFSQTAPKGGFTPNVTTAVQTETPAPAAPARVDDGAVRVAKEKLPKEVLAGVSPRDISGGAVVVRPRVFSSEASFDRYLRETVGTQHINQRAHEKFDPPEPKAGKEKNRKS